MTLWKMRSSEEQTGEVRGEVEVEVGKHGELVLNLHAPVIMLFLSGLGGGDLEAAGGK